MKKPNDNRKQVANKSLNELQSQKIEDGKRVKGGMTRATKKGKIGEGSKTSAG